MSLQYLYNPNGQIVAIQLPIEEWEMLKSKHPDIDSGNNDLADFQKELIDNRMNEIAVNPARILPIDTLLAELDRNG